MGSGHILVYAFDVLMQIYLSVGYSERDAAKSIVENNLYGLDIDDRAAQLAYFALMMKARQYDSRFLTRGVQPHVYAIQESNALQPFERLSRQMRLDTLCLNTANDLIATYRDAKEYGSLLSPKINSLPDVPHLMRQLEEASLTDLEIQSWYEKASRLLPQLARQTEVLQQRYDVVVTNPPYMGSSGMNALLSSYVKEEYPDSKSDLFACFMERCGAFLKPKAYQAMITQHAWMFLTSFERLRTNLLKHQQIINMAHLGARAFEEIGGEVVQTTTFVTSQSNIANYRGIYVRLIEPTSQDAKEEMFLAEENRYYANQGDFSKIPGAPFAYWINSRTLKLYEVDSLMQKYVQTKQGLKSSNDALFFRYWTEVNINRIGFAMQDHSDAIKSNKKWFPLNKGGTTKWYGDGWYIINWENDGDEIKEYAKSLYKSVTRTITSIDFYFKECISWPQITSSPSFRYIPRGFIFNAAGPSMFLTKSEILYTLGFLNTPIVKAFASVLNPTINLNVTDLLKIPFIICRDSRKNVELKVKECVQLSTFCWDSFETSWDFKKHPMI